MSDKKLKINSKNEKEKESSVAGTKSFREVLIDLRKSKNLTQKDLAEKLNISNKSISKWENGDNYPTLEMIYQISKFYHVSFLDLLTIRVSNDNPDDEIVREIINEFTNVNAKKRKKIKICFIISSIVMFILILAMIFTNSYNRFKVYKVGLENSEFYPIKGVYVETNIRDIIYLGDIKLRNYEVKDDAIVSIDFYYLENDTEYLIQNFSKLKNIYMVGSQSYVEIDDFSDYFDNMYLRVNIYSGEDKIELTTKLIFVLDFSNNKIYYTDENVNEEVGRIKITKTTNEIKRILLDNGFVEDTKYVLKKSEKDAISKYYLDLYMLTYNYEKNDFSYRYTYIIDKEVLEVVIIDNDSIEIENYTYNISTNEMNCNVGACNDYKNILKTLEENILYLLE